MMTTKKPTEATGEAEGAKAPAPRHVLYVVNRPYSAGEAPEIVRARVKRAHDGEPDRLDLVLCGRKRAGGEPETACARRSDRQEPGTWHEEVK